VDAASEHLVEVLGHVGQLVDSLFHVFIVNVERGALGRIPSQPDRVVAAVGFDRRHRAALRQIERAVGVGAGDRVVSGLGQDGLRAVGINENHVEIIIVVQSEAECERGETSITCVRPSCVGYIRNSPIAKPTQHQCKYE
jgi:hypothetical protein